ncbi:MAG: hypothetical protein ACH350_04050 [Parachlamydiaceae bacterium]
MNNIINNPFLTICSPQINATIETYPAKSSIASKHRDQSTLFSSQIAELTPSENKKRKLYNTEFEENEEMKLSFQKEVPLLKYDTADNKSIIMTYIPSSPSSIASTAPTVLDESEEKFLSLEETANDQLYPKLTRAALNAFDAQELPKNEECSEAPYPLLKRTKSISSSFYPTESAINPANLKKGQNRLKTPQSYPRPIPLRNELTTQWKDRFHQEKILLGKIFLSSYQTASSYDLATTDHEAVHLNSNAREDEPSIHILITEGFKELIVHLQNMSADERRLFLESQQIDIYFQTWIRRYAVESKLDLETYISAAKIKKDVAVHPDPDGTYTLRMIPEEKLDQLLKICGEFFRTALVKETFFKIDEELKG